MFNFLDEWESTGLSSQNIQRACGFLHPGYLLVLLSCINISFLMEMQNTAHVIQVLILLHSKNKDTTPLLTVCSLFFPECVYF